MSVVCLQNVNMTLFVRWSIVHCLPHYHYILRSFYCFAIPSSTYIENRLTAFIKTTARTDSTLHVSPCNVPTSGSTSVYQQCVAWKGTWKRAGCHTLPTVYWNYGKWLKMSGIFNISRHWQQLYILYNWNRNSPFTSLHQASAESQDGTKMATSCIMLCLLVYDPRSRPWSQPLKVRCVSVLPNGNSQEE